MADDTRNSSNSIDSFSLIEEGCLRRLSPNIENIVYHKSLNVILVFNRQGRAIVLDIASGTVLHETQFIANLNPTSNKPLDSETTTSCSASRDDAEPVSSESSGTLRCLSVAERGTVVLAWKDLLGVRKDYFGRTLLLESILQAPAAHEDEIVSLELTHNEAMLLRECLQTLDLSQSDSELGAYQTQVINVLTKHMKQYLFSISKGSRMSSNWSIVTLELPLKTLKTVCTHAVLELKKTNRNIPALPIAASIVVRLSTLQAQPSQPSAEGVKEDALTPFFSSSNGSTNNNNFGMWESSSCPALHPMMSEAARRETFASWPHMNYKWALPPQMAEAGFYHQPNTPESDRAVCFLCNVCLICWEPSDEPWSEHERHASSCPLVKGDYTCNVPVAVTMATQPAVRQANQHQVISCISTTSCPDLFATGTESGSITLWNINGPLKKEISFEASQFEDVPTDSQLQLTSLSVVASRADGESQSGDEVMRSSLLAAVTLGRRPCIAVYDLIWKRNNQNSDRTPENSAASNDFSGSSVAKKGGTTKKILPPPPVLGSGTSSAGIGPSTSDNQNPSLFFTFGDDPLEEEMYMAPHASIEPGEKFGKATGLLNKLMHNMASPFTNTIMTHSFLAEKTVSNAANPLVKPSTAGPAVSDQPEIKKIALLDLSKLIQSDGTGVISLTPTADASHVIAVLAPTDSNSASAAERPFASVQSAQNSSLASSDASPAAPPSLTDDRSKEALLRSIWDRLSYGDRGKCHLLLFRVDFQADLGTVLLQQPLQSLDLNWNDCPQSLISLPMPEKEELDGPSSEHRGPWKFAVITRDGRLRLLVLESGTVQWVDVCPAEAKVFTSVTYCHSVERICASSESGDLVFFKIHQKCGRRQLRPEKESKGKNPIKLLIQQPLQPDLLASLHHLTLAERLPASCNPTINAASCWMELPVNQRQRRQPQPWILQQSGPNSSANFGASSNESDGLPTSRLFKLHYDKFSWDEHFLEISLPHSVALANVNLRFLLIPSCSTPPEIQVSLLEQRSRCLQWGRSSVDAEEVDSNINFNMGSSSRVASAMTESSVNPILLGEYLEAHDAVLLCGPYRLANFIDSSGQVANLTLSSHQLLQSTARNFLIHLKYVPAIGQVSNSSLLVTPRTPASSGSGARRTIQTKGCDWIQEVTISIHRSKPTTVPQERIQRCALLASTTATGQLLDYGIRTLSIREQIMVLHLLNWKTATHYGNPPVGSPLSTGDIAGHVTEILNQFESLVDKFLIGGNRSTAQLVVQLLLSTRELGLQYLPDGEEEIEDVTERLVDYMLQSLNRLHQISSPGVIHWYLVFLNRLHAKCRVDLTRPCLSELVRITSELQKRKEPLQQLLQSRYGFGGRPFEASLFLVEPNVKSGPHQGQGNSIAAYFSALNQIVSAGDRDKLQSHLDLLGLKRSFDLLDVEPLPFTLLSASDGTRLERSDSGNSQFTAVALNGLVEASKLGHDNKESGSSQRWQHLLGSTSPYVVVMERLHSGGRKFVILDFGRSILLTDVYIPLCPDWVNIAVDVWNRTDKGKNDADVIRLATSCDISRRPLILHDLQPPLLCRYLRLTIAGRQGLSAASCRTPVGFFYGYSHILPCDLFPAQPSSAQPNPILGLEEVQENIATLEVLADHIQCHYSLSCDRLRNLVQPLLTQWHKDSSSSSSHHVDHYLQSQINPNPTNSDEDAKITEAYEECLKLQCQLNLLWGSIRRFRRCIRESSGQSADEVSPQTIPISQTSSHQLQYIAQGLVNLLLASTVEQPMTVDQKVADQLFRNVWLSSNPSVQLSTAALLALSKESIRWMPTFLAQMIRRTLSSDPSTALFPKDRIFVTLLFMAFKSMQMQPNPSEIYLLDPVLLVLDDQLSPLEEDAQNPIPLSYLDLPFVNWILLYCCCCLDKTSAGFKASDSLKSRDQRWDFMQAESLLNRDGSASGEPKNSGSAASRIYRRKLQKKLMQQPHYGVSWPSGGVLSGANKAKFMHVHSKTTKGGMSTDSTQLRRPPVDVDDSELLDESKESGPSVVLYPICSPSVAARVAKKLVAFLILIGSSGSHEETFLLTCKVLARLMNGIQLSQITDQAQLTILLKLAVNGKKSSQQWLHHAIFCLLIDCLRSNKNGHKTPTAAGALFGDRNRYEGSSRSTPDLDSASSSTSSTPVMKKLTAASVSSATLTVPPPPPKTMPPGIPHELLVYEQTKSALAASTKLDQHVDDIMELFDNPNSDSVPPVLKKAWPSISSVMKNLADCKNSISTGSTSASTSSASAPDESSFLGVWDLRDELCIDGPWKQKCDQLGDIFYETVLHGLISNSTCPEEKRRSTPEENQVEDGANPRNTSDYQLLSATFDQLFASANWRRSQHDVVSTLRLWILLNRESSNSDESGNGSSVSPSNDTPVILLNQEAIQRILEGLTKIPSMDVGDWMIVFRSLKWFTSPRWLLAESVAENNRRADDDSLASQTSSGASRESPPSSRAGELADEMCAGTVIRSPNLTRILYNFISGEGLLPFSMCDKQLVGPHIVTSLGDALACLRVWCNTALVGSQLGIRLRDSLFELFLGLSSLPNGPVVKGVGPLDAQMCFVESLLKLSVQGLESGLIIRVIQAIVSLTHLHLSRRGGLSCVDNSSQLSEDDRVCFSGMGIPDLQSARSSSSSSSGRATPSSLLILNLQLAIRLVSLDQGSSINVADSVLGSSSIVEELLDAINHCTASPFASSLGISAFGDAEFSATHLTTIADHALQLLQQLFIRTSNVRLLFYRLIDYISAAGAACDVSEPLLIFMLYILKDKENVRIFNQVGGFQEICKALSRSPVQISNSHSRLVSNVLSYVSQTSQSNPKSRLNPRPRPFSQNPYLDSASLNPLVVIRRSGLRIDEEEDFGILNLAPLSTISCNHPSAQPADVLLHPSPPHRRARSPSWSHHFYPAEQFIELTITLPCPVLIREVQLHPHLTSLATCPSAVGIETSLESGNQFSPIGAVLSSTGLTTISFKLENPQVAALILLRLYKPRDSSNIGLAQIRVLGTLALPTFGVSGFGTSDPGLNPGLTWLCVLHHCLSTASREDPPLLHSLCETAGNVHRILEQCCSLLNVVYSVPKAGVLADSVQMASDILLHLGRHSRDLSHRFVELQLKDPPSSLAGCSPAVANVLHELCSAELCPDIQQQASRLLLQWLQKTSNTCKNGGSSHVSTAMVHCAAAVLWDSRSSDQLVSLEFAKSLFDWTKFIQNGELKAAVDYSLCSICRHSPSFFNSLLTLAPTDSADIVHDAQTMETLARAAQSTLSLEQLIQSGLLDQLCRSIANFSGAVLENSPHSLSQEAAASVSLDFLTLLCEQWGCDSTRDLLAPYIAPQFVRQLLTALCNYPRSSQVRGYIEDAAVSFFRQFCWAHQENSRKFAQVLLAVLQPAGDSRLLTGFMRRLLLQLLLEPEKIYVHVTYPSGNILCSPTLSSCAIPEPRHPAYKHGKKHKLLYISAETTITELVRFLTDGTSQPLLAPKAPSSKRADRLTFICDDKKGTLTTATQKQSELEDQQRRLLSQINKMHYFLTLCNDRSPIPGNWTLSQALNYQRQKYPGQGALRILLHVDDDSSTKTSEEIVSQAQPLTTVLEEFAALGGLAVLSQHLPMLLCASTSPSAVTFDGPSSTRPGPSQNGLASAVTSSQVASVNGMGATAETIDSWVKLDGGSEDLDEEMEEMLMPPGYFPPPTPQSYVNKRPKTVNAGPTTFALPLHSLAAFSLFLSMPLYTEAVLQDRRRAQMLLRLALGVSDDGQGGNILNSLDAAQFPILPFILLQQVLDGHALETEKGSALRQQAIDMGILQLLLACLAVFTQQVTSANVTIPALNIQFVIGGFAGSSAPVKSSDPSNQDHPPTVPTTPSATTSAANNANGSIQQLQQQQQYWAKGTGFGTGSTAQTWDVDGAIERQRQQEEQATCLLHALAAYIRPASAVVAVSHRLPAELLSIIQSSHLVPAICSYLRNDSVMDMARHVPLYKALLLLLRSMASCPSLIPLLLPEPPASSASSSSDRESQSIYSLLKKLKKYVSSYTARLASVQNRIGASSGPEETESEEGVADLSKDISTTWNLVRSVVLERLGMDEVDGHDDKNSAASGLVSGVERIVPIDMLDSPTPDQLYCDVMRPLQFDSYELLVESPENGLGMRFTVAYHFENAVRSAGDRCHPSRMKRLAQEAATLMTSLPLSNSSSVFTRCDTDRLDIMKVLITGPSDTPYANGCFEFDVYFPPDYPQSPMQVHLATTGRHTVRFNPNLYNDGKVCLSVLNTWHGRPEEKWNPHTSSLLQVLVSIQSLILVSEPYFNEPGYERSRGTPSGSQNSRDYDVNIRQATVKWAMLEQIRNPSLCFKQVVHSHFWLKRREIEKQCEDWIADMETQVESDPNGSRAVAVSLTALKRHYSQLKEELARLTPPPNLLDARQPIESDKPSEPEEVKVTAAPQPEISREASEGIKLTNESNTIDSNALKELSLLEKDLIFSNDTDSVDNLPWPEDCEDSETELDNFVSQFTM